MAKELKDNSGDSKVIDGRLHTQNEKGKYEPMPISMDEARSKRLEKRDSPAYYSHLSDGTRTHIQKSANLNMSGGAKVLSSAPGIAYGVVDIVAGEKVSGVAALVGSAPNYIKGRVEGYQGNFEKAKAIGSFATDVKGLSLEEKGAAVSEFANADVAASKEAFTNEYDNVTNGIRGVMGAAKDIKGNTKTGATREYVNSKGEQKKTSERRMPDTSNMKSANEAGHEFD